LRDTNQHIPTGAPRQTMNFAELNLIDANATLRPLISFVLGMAIYAVFIFNFYRFMGRKNIFELNLDKYQQSRFQFLRVMLHLIFYVIKYLVVFPFVAFAWFVILTVLLVFLAKDQPIERILLVSIAVLSAIRITSYYNEDLSRDLAKMLPFALLGVFIIDLSYFSLAGSIGALQQALTQWESVTYYLIFVMGLELVLRITSPVLNLVILPSKSR
jgi:hypothetical protein